MSSTSKKGVFLVGPGFIGQEVLDRLLETGLYNITTLVRRPEAATSLEKQGIKTIPGTLEDSDIITEQSAQSDIVFHTATADHIPSVEAIIRGIERRVAAGKHNTIYIHTSGCTFLCDDSNGNYVSDTIYTDKDPAPMDARPDTSSHRLIDLKIIEARKRLGNKAKLFIMFPPLIYGANNYGRLSIQAITMARFAMKHKYAGHVGGGKALWMPIHVNDLSYGYLTILKWLETSPPEVALEHPYFFCENGQEVSWGEIAGFIGEGLKQEDVLQDATPREVPQELYDDLFGNYSMVVIGQNSRNRAERLRELGWRPKHLDIREAFFTQELPIILRDNKEPEKFSGYGAVAASGSG